jgi:hypothetical protein
MSELFEHTISDLRGNPDNSPDKQREYWSRIAAFTDDELYKECRSVIWLSAFASNNPRSCYHWQCDSCWREAHNRGKEEIYSRAHKDEIRANGY